MKIAALMFACLLVSAFVQTTFNGVLPIGYQYLMVIIGCGALGFTWDKLWRTMGGM